MPPHSFLEDLWFRLTQGDFPLALQILLIVVAGYVAGQVLRKLMPLWMQKLNIQDSAVMTRTGQTLRKLVLALSICTAVKFKLMEALALPPAVAIICRVLLGFLIALISGFAIGKIVRSPAAYWLQKIAPKGRSSPIADVGRVVEGTFVTLALCLALQMELKHFVEVKNLVANWEKYRGIVPFVMYLIAGMVLGKLLRYPIAQWIEGMTPETDHTTSVRISRRVERAIFLLVFSIVLQAGAIDVLRLPQKVQDKADKAVVVLMAFASTLLFLQIVEIILCSLQKKWRGADAVDEHLLKFIRKGLYFFVIVIAVIVTAQNLGVQVTGVIAGLGVGGAALALGLQGLIGNIIGTMEIVADKLFRVGDRIQFDQYDGFVVDVGLRSTRVRAISGEEVLVPNKRIAEVQVRNFSRNGLVRTSTVVGILYSTSNDQVQRAMQIMETILKERKDIDSHQIYLKNLAPYSLDLEAIFWARYQTSSEYNQLIGAIHLEIKKRFDAAQIGFAFPTQTLHVVKS